MSDLHKEQSRDIWYKETQMKSILVDIDHTVSDAFWRDPMIDNGGWDAYHAASSRDHPIDDIVTLLNHMSNYYCIIALTARPGKWRRLTMDWSLKHGIHIDELLMRADDNYHRAPELKIALAMQRFGDKLLEEVAFIMDDREDVITAFKGIGITALQVYARRTGTPNDGSR